MMRPYKGRTVKPGDKVDVYRNVTTRDWSIRAAEGPLKGKVLAHADVVSLEEVDFHVGESGRQRVLREGRKNVHAWATGKLTDKVKTPFLMMGWDVRYNPFKGPDFMTHGGDAVQSAWYARFTDEGVVKI